jgi:hypothetical protein
VPTIAGRRRAFLVRSIRSRIHCIENAGNARTDVIAKYSIGAVVETTEVGETTEDVSAVV